MIGEPSIAASILGYVSPLYAKTVKDLLYKNVSSDYNNRRAHLFFNANPKPTLHALPLRDSLKFLESEGFATTPETIDEATSEQHKYYTPLTWAVKSRNPNAVIDLLKDGANINAQNTLGNTALHMAADAEANDTNDKALCLAIADILLRAGANLKTINADNNTPQDIATSKAGNDGANFYNKFII